MLPPDVWKRRRASVYADAGFDVTGPEFAAGAATGWCTAGARPSRSAFSFAAFRRRSSLSASILDLIRCLAAISSCFSLRFFSASLICSFFWRSSFISWVSLVDFRRISYITIRNLVAIVLSAGCVESTQTFMVSRGTLRGFGKEQDKNISGDKGPAKIVSIHPCWRMKRIS